MAWIRACGGGGLPKKLELIKNKVIKNASIWGGNLIGTSGGYLSTEYSWKTDTPTIAYSESVGFSVNQIGVTTVAPMYSIDLTNYSKLTITVANKAYGLRFGLSKTFTGNTRNWATIISTVDLKSGTYTYVLDISSYSGEYYIMINNNGVNNITDANLYPMYITDIVLE